MHGGWMKGWNKKFSQTNCSVLSCPTIPCSDGHLFKSNNCRSFYSHFQQNVIPLSAEYHVLSYVGVLFHVLCPVRLSGVREAAKRESWTDPTDKYKTIKICPFIINSISVRDRGPRSRSKKGLCFKNHTLLTVMGWLSDQPTNQPVSFSCFNRTLHQVIPFLSYKRRRMNEWFGRMTTKNPLHTLFLYSGFFVSSSMEFLKRVFADPKIFPMLLTTW